MSLSMATQTWTPPVPGVSDTWRRRSKSLLIAQEVWTVGCNGHAPPEPKAAVPVGHAESSNAVASKPGIPSQAVCWYFQPVAPYGTTVIPGAAGSDATGSGPVGCGRTDPAACC